MPTKKKPGSWAGTPGERNGSVSTNRNNIRHVPPSQAKSIIGTTPNPAELAEAELTATLIVQGGKVVDQVKDAICPTDFHLKKHRRIWEAAFELHEQGHAVDLVGIAARLQETGNLESVGAGFLSRTADNAPLSMDPAGHARVVKSAALMREAYFLGLKISSDSSNGVAAKNIMDSLEKISAVMGRLRDAENVGAKSQWDEPLDMKTAIFERPDPIRWHFYQRMPKGRGGIMSGIGGVSKTTTLYHMAKGSALGFLPWGWKVENTGKAVLVLTEDTAHDVRHTIYYLADSLNDEQKHTLSENLIIYPLAGKDTRLMVKTSNGTVEKSPLFYSLQQKIIGLGGVVFVGLDPALSVSEGDENDQGHQRALGKMADDMAVTTGATVVLVSHAAKGSLLKDELTSHNSRGGGAITDAVRFEYAMRNMTAIEGNKAGITDIEERHRHVQLVCTKGNKIPPAAKVPAWLRRDDFGNLSEVEIILDEKGTLTERDMEVLTVHSEMGVFCTPKLKDWRAECFKRGLITGSTENAQTQAMKRVLNKLLKAGLIEKGIGNGIYTQTAETTEPPF